MTATSPSTFGALLRHHRLAAGLTQEDLAERSGVSPRGIQVLERGGRTAPRAETVRLLTEALGLSAEARAELIAAARPELAAPVAPAFIPSNLPVPPTPLVGREREVAEACALLRRPEVHLLTLTGPAGVGKTRLAVAIAAELREDFADGTVWVELAPLRDPTLASTAVAQAFGVREDGDRPLTDLLRAVVAGRRLLLVLDNFEHLLPAAPLVATLLATGPSLAVLATSRARLRLRGEREFPIPPLAVPEADSLSQPPFAGLAGVASVRLFVERAQAVEPEFALTPETAPPVAAICRRLDGLPLALELAAARVKVLPPALLLTRLERRLPLLTGGPRDAPARQQTMRDTIAWSHDLLAPLEQICFRRLSAFASGCTLDGAEAIVALDDTMEIDVLETLEGLIDHSLVQTRPGRDSSEPRYRMLETIREFAAERLEASGESDRVRSAFEAFLIQVAETAESGLHGPQQLRWLDRLEDEHDNIRAVLGGALERGDGETALRLAPRLWDFWRIHGYPVEGQAWLERALALADAASPDRRAAAEFALGKISITLGDYGAADAHFRASITLRRELGDLLTLADALSGLAVVAINTDAFDEAKELGEEALAISRELGDARGTATALFNLGMLAREDGQLPHAIALLGESLTLWRQLSDSKWIALASLNLANAYRLSGDTEKAQWLLSESNELYERIGDRYQLAVIAHNRGHLEREAGRATRANQLYADALRYAEEVGAPEVMVESIEWIAITAAATSQARSALMLFGAAATVRTALRLPLLGPDARVVTAGLDAATRAAGPDAEEALATGSMLTLEQARDAALALAREAPSGERLDEDRASAAVAAAPWPKPRPGHHRRR